MSNEHENDGVSRRTFVKGAGLAAAGAALGTDVAGRVAAHSPFETRFANPRVREAAKVWESKPWRDGYRGRPDRTVALDDSGIDIRHPDLGPWNGVTAVALDTDGSNKVPEIQLASEGGLETWDESRHPVSVDNHEQTRSEVLGPGTTVEGSETAFDPFIPPEDKDIAQLDATLRWQPKNVPLPGAVPILSEAGEDQSFRIELNVGSSSDPEWITLQTIDTGKNPEQLNRVPVVPGQEHRFVAGQFANVVAQGEVQWTYHTFDANLSTLSESKVFADSDDDLPPKTVGWFDAGDRYGQPFAPEDPNSHGTHVSSIMVGSGRASAIDPHRYTEDSPRAILTAGDVLSYEVEAQPGTGVFGVATGEGIEVLIEGPDGRQLRSSGVTAFVGGDKEALPIDDARVDHPTVDERHPVRNGERQPATYTVYVRPSSGEAVATGQVEDVAVGAFLPPEEATLADDAMHTGIAPEQGLFGMQGLSGPAAALGLYADQMVPTFNIRAVNMSWGGLVPAGGMLGGSSAEADVKSIAEGGVLTVAAAGNTFGAPTGAPGLADEAVAVASTNYVDGVTSYTDGGSPYQQDEDEEPAYGKPDVCAPGGSLEAGVRAARAKSDGVPDGVDGVRDYVNFPGTSMASPYVCGVATLVAQAMEEGAPESLRLPSPKDLHANYSAQNRLEHVLRLKSVLTSTASSTAFTAAPYHRHPVTYRHTGQDTYEGFGRVNPDAAVDAVTRDLLADATETNGSLQATVSENVGLNVPDDSRAVAGYVQLNEGTLDVSLEHSHYAGGNRGLTKGAPWLDLFVYRADEPGTNGEPNVVASAQGVQGSASVTVEIDGSEQSDGVAPGTFFVVAKLVNIPGVVNGYDVQSRFDLDLSFAPEPTVLTASGSRADDGSVFTKGGTNEVQVTLESFSEDADEVRVFDFVPDGWTVLTGFSHQVEGTESVEDGTVVDLGTVNYTEVDGDEESVTKTYLVEATGDTGRYEFGPAKAVVESATKGSSFDQSEAEFGGTDTNTIVGVEQPNL